MIKEEMQNEEEIERTPSYEELCERYSDSELEISARGHSNVHITVKIKDWVLNFPAEQDLTDTYLRMITPEKYDWVFDIMLIEYTMTEEEERVFNEIAFGRDGTDSGTLPKKPPEELITFMKDTGIVPGGIDEDTS